METTCCCACGVLTTAALLYHSEQLFPSRSQLFPVLSHTTLAFTIKTTLRLMMMKRRDEDETLFSRAQLTMLSSKKRGKVCTLKLSFLLVGGWKLCDGEALYLIGEADGEEENDMLIRS